MPVADTTTRLEQHTEVTANTQAVDCLSETTGLSKQHLKQVMQKGAVWLTPGSAHTNEHDKRQHSQHTQRLRRAKKPLRQGDILHLYYDPEILASQPLPATLIADEGDYSVWHKPQGMLCQGSKWGDHCTIARWAEQHLQPERPAFMVHRLDRATTGLILIAHKKKTAAILSQAFQQRRIEKHYKAVVRGQFPTEPKTCQTPIDGRSACSHFQCLDFDPGHQQSLLSVQIDSGRKHQIRRHLAELGFPIIGDRLHGIADSSQAQPDLQLCACELHFACPRSGQPKHFLLESSLHPNLPVASTPNK